jgi:hypothetical protein
VTSGSSCRSSSIKGRSWCSRPRRRSKPAGTEPGFFLQIAEGIDDRTWLHHSRAGDYSQWLRDKIKDDELADDVALTEEDETLTPRESRRRIKDAIECRYTSPAERARSAYK